MVTSDLCTLVLVDIVKFKFSLLLVEISREDDFISQVILCLSVSLLFVSFSSVKAYVPVSSS
jgi:hypothetical protein